MKPKHLGKALTFGELIENVYDAYGKRKAQGILWLAIKTQLIVFRRGVRSVPGRRNAQA